MTEDQIKHMVNRFLGWKLPESFNPDGGISFKRTFNEHTDHPMKHEPSGTNLLDASQADAMVRYMIDGMPHDTPDWPPAASARDFPEGTGRHGSTGQLWLVRDGRWARQS